MFNFCVYFKIRGTSYQANPLHRSSEPFLLTKPQHGSFTGEKVSTQYLVTISICSPDSEEKPCGLFGQLSLIFSFMLVNRMLWLDVHVMYKLSNFDLAGRSTLIIIFVWETSGAPHWWFWIDWFPFCDSCDLPSPSVRVASYAPLQLYDVRQPEREWISLYWSFFPGFRFVHSTDSRSFQQRTFQFKKKLVKNKPCKLT